MPYNHPGITIRLVRTTYVGLCIIRNTSLQLTIVISSFYVHDIHIGLVGAGYLNQIEQGQDYIKSIMGDYKPIPDVDDMKNDIPATNDMKVLQKVVDLETGTIGNVVLRSITESFWQKVIEATKTRRVCALGTPGIGKSTTTCILIRMLLQQNKTVVYRLRKLDTKGFVYMFSPSMDSLEEVVNVRVIEEKDFKYWDTNVNQADIYYVVDPGPTIDNCNLSSDFEGKVIIVASPDNRHWGESDFEKSRRNISGEFLFFPVWTLSELLCAKKYFDYCFGEEEDDKEIICRYEKVGGVPRNIFTDKNKFSDILVCQKTALNNVDESQLRKLTSNDKDAAVTSEKDQPKSLVMVYEGSSDKNFKHFSIGVSSKFVMSKLIQKNAVFMWNQMVSLSVEHGGYGWKIFESYCQEILLGKPKEYSYCKYHNGTGLVTLGKKLKLGGCTAIKGTRGNLITTATDTAATNKKTNNNDQTLYYSFHPNHVFIDFIYKKKDTIYAFQVTLADNHSCNPEYLKKFAKEAGGPSKFVMHYLSYDAKYDKFKLQPKNPLRKLEGHDWTIYLVCIPRPGEIVTKH